MPMDNTRPHVTHFLSCIFVVIDCFLCCNGRFRGHCPVRSFFRGGVGGDVGGGVGGGLGGGVGHGVGHGRG